jgi:peptidoglycan/LPS O-acetylase OafA/YrhL
MPAGEVRAMIGLRRSATYLPELEALRGIAVTLVFLMHFDGYLVMPWYRTGPPAWPMVFVRTDRLGVDLFFVLSAFLLSLPFLAQASGGTRVDLGHYFRRRALRILPLYWTAVVVGTALSTRRPADLLRGLPSLAFLNLGATSLHPYGDVWWSLSTEAQFYLVLPLLGLLPTTRAGRAVGLALLGVYAATYVAFSTQLLAVRSIATVLQLEASLFGRGPLFLSGILAALVYRRFGGKIRATLERSAWMRNGGCDLLVVVLLAAFARFLGWEGTLGPARLAAWFQGLDLVSGAALALLLLFLLLAPLRLKAVVVNPALARLGVLSYSIYLIHFPFIAQAMPVIRGPLGLTVWRWEPRAALLLACVAVPCLALSTLTYRFIERPFLERKSRLAA